MDGHVWIKIEKCQKEVFTVTFSIIVTEKL